MPCALQVDGWQGETPGPEAMAAGAAAQPKKQRSRWDETPAGAGAGALGATPAGAGMGLTPGFFTGATPAVGLAGMETPATALRVAAAGQQVRALGQVVMKVVVSRDWEGKRKREGCH